MGEYNAESLKVANSKLKVLHDELSCDLNEEREMVKYLHGVIKNYEYLLRSNSQRSNPRPRIIKRHSIKSSKSGSRAEDQFLQKFVDMDKEMRSSRLEEEKTTSLKHSRHRTKTNQETLIGNTGNKMLDKATAKEEGVLEVSTIMRPISMGQTREINSFRNKTCDIEDLTIEELDSTSDSFDEESSEEILRIPENYYAKLERSRSPCVRHRVVQQAWTEPVNDEQKQGNALLLRKSHTTDSGTVKSCYDRADEVGHASKTNIVNSQRRDSIECPEEVLNYGHATQKDLIDKIRFTSEILEEHAVGTKKRHVIATHKASAKGIHSSLQTDVYAPASRDGMIQELNIILDKLFWKLNKCDKSLGRSDVLLSKMERRIDYLESFALGEESECV